MKNRVGFIIFMCFFFLNFIHAQSKIYNDWNLAQIMAVDQNKNILIVITGSDWCTACKDLNNNIMESAEFQKLANEKLVIFEINIPNPMDINSKLAKDYNYFKALYNAPSLPSLILVDSDGKEIIKFINQLPSKEQLISKLSLY